MLQWFPPVIIVSKYSSKDFFENCSKNPCWSLSEASSKISSKIIKKYVQWFLSSKNSPRTLLRYFKSIPKKTTSTNTAEFPNVCFFPKLLFFQLCYRICFLSYISNYSLLLSSRDQCPVKGFERGWTKNIQKNSSF